MFKRYSNMEVKSDINIIPLLDVLLVIMLIFIATAPNSIHNIEIDLPNAKTAKTVNNDINPLVIVEIYNTEKYSLFIDNKRQKQLSYKDIATEVHNCIAKNPKTVFIVAGAKDLPYNEIIKILNLLHQVGANSIGLMTNPV